MVRSFYINVHRTRFIELFDARCWNSMKKVFYFSFSSIKWISPCIRLPFIIRLSN